MRLFYLVAMETDHYSWSSCFLGTTFAMFLNILRCKLEKYVDFPGDIIIIHILKKIIYKSIIC